LKREGIFSVVPIAIQSTREELYQRHLQVESKLVENILRRSIFQKGQGTNKADGNAGSVTPKHLFRRIEGLEETSQWLVLYYLYQLLTDAWERTGYHREIEIFIDEFVPPSDAVQHLKPVSVVLLTMLRKLRHEVSIERATYAANVLEVLNSAQNVTKYSRRAVTATEDLNADELLDIRDWISEVAQISANYADGLIHVGEAFRAWWANHPEWIEISTKAIAEAKLLEKTLSEDEYASELRAHRLALEHLALESIENSATVGHVQVYALYTVGIDNLNARRLDHQKIIEAWKRNDLKPQPNVFYRPMLTDIWDSVWLDDPIEQVVEYDLGEIRMSVGPFSERSDEKSKTLSLRAQLRVQRFGIACVRFVGSLRDVGLMELHAVRRRLSPYCAPHDNCFSDVAIAILQNFCAAVMTTDAELKASVRVPEADELYFQFVASVRDFGNFDPKDDQKHRHQKLVDNLLRSPIDPTSTSIADWALKVPNDPQSGSHATTRAYPGDVTFSFVTNNAVIVATKLPSFGADEFDEFAEALALLPAVKGRWIRSLTQAITEARQFMEVSPTGHFKGATKKQITNAGLFLQRVALDIAFEIRSLREGAWAANPITQGMVRDFVEQSSLAVTIAEVDRLLDQARETYNLLDRIGTAQDAQRKDLAEIYLNSFVALISVFSVGALFEFLKVDLAFDTKILILCVMAASVFASLLFIFGRQR
jgi:hypothetical protein